MSMSKKDFVALADVVRANTPNPAKNETQSGMEIQHAIMRSALADYCAAQNPRFNRSRWLAYIAGECGPSGGTVTPLRALRHHVTGAIERGEAQAIIEHR